ncbi:ABC transporter permease [Brucellaceae bacterium C25G]
MRAVITSNAVFQSFLLKLYRVTFATSIILSSAILLLVTAWAFLPHIFTDMSPYAVNPAIRYTFPGAEHLFGTDNLGRDLFSRVVYGSAYSLQAAIIAMTVGFGGGVIIGLVSGFSGGWVDDILMRIVDVSLAIPGLLLSLLVITALGFGTINVAIAVGIGAIAGFARVMRAETLRVRNTAYVEAADAYGVGFFTILVRHVLPNALGPALALLPLEFGSAILSVAALGFLGYGATPPEPEWGALVAEGRNYLRTYWWMATLPGVVITIVVFAANFLSRQLYRRLTR